VPEMAYLVLDRLVAPNWGHILRHCCCWKGDVVPEQLDVGQIAELSTRRIT
jgi:hypothetical protein